MFLSFFLYNHIKYIGIKILKQQTEYAKYIKMEWKMKLTSSSNVKTLKILEKLMSKLKNM
jgi:hypothetical protein